MAITVEDAKQYLTSIGVTLPDVIVNALFGRLGNIELCMNGAGYDESTQDLIKLYLMSLFGLVSVDGQVSSQTAPSGASRSYRYGSLGDRYKSILASLRALDPNGCTGALIPDDPTADRCALFVSPGDDCE